MAEILRPNFDKLWASAGNVIEPSELKIERGWVEEVPPSQWENWIQLRQDQAIKYIFQRGIPAWDAGEEYFAGRSAVLLDGDIYIALRNNVNKSPKTNTDDWRVVTKDSTIANITGLQAALNNKADKTVSITGVGGLTGGGTLAANRTIDLSAATKNSLSLADSSLQKAQNLNDVPNKNAARYNLGLGGAATRDVVTSVTDTSEGDKLVTQRWKGFSRYIMLDGNLPIADQVVDGLTLQAKGAAPIPPDSPTGTSGVKVLTVGDSLWPTQIAFDDFSQRMWIRTRTSAGWAFSPWREIYHTGNILKTTGNNDNFPMSQNAVTDALNTKADKSTAIVAGTGLSGGGTLASNRTLSVKFGSAAGTAAEGNDSRLSNAREWTASTVSQAEAEAGTATARRAWTAQRVRQAITAWFNGVSGTIGRTILGRNTAAQVRGDLGLGSAATSDVVQTTGHSATEIMSQKAVTDALNTKANLNNSGSMGIGVGQTWQNMAGTRTGQTWYTNTTGRAIQVACYTDVRDMRFQVRENENATIINLSSLYGSGHERAQLPFIVPSGWQYRLDKSKSSTNFHWVELR